MVLTGALDGQEDMSKDEHSEAEYSEGDFQMFSDED